MVRMQSWPGWQLISTAFRSLFFAEKRRVIAGADTAGSRLLANVSCWMGKIPRISPMSHRLTSRARPYSEPSATIVWRALHNLGIEKRTILWNALQMHPHEPWNEQSNRTPKSSEIKIGKPALQMLVGEFPSAKVVAVGKSAERLLNEMGVVLAATVRHPARGGATAFKQELERLVSG